MVVFRLQKWWLVKEKSGLLGTPQPRKVLGDRFINSPLITMCCLSQALPVPPFPSFNSIVSSRWLWGIFSYLGFHVVPKGSSENYCAWQFLAIQKLKEIAAGNHGNLFL